MLSSLSSSFLGSHPPSSSPPLLQQSLRHTNPSSRHFNVLLSPPTFFPHSHPPPPPMKPTTATATSAAAAAAALLTSTTSAFFALNSQRRRRLLLTVQCGSKSGEVSGAAGGRGGGGIEWRKKSEGTHNDTQSTRPSSSSTPPSNRVPNGSRNMQRKVRPGEGIPSQRGSRRTSEVDSDKIKGRKNTLLEDGITPAPSKRIKPPKIKEQVKILSPLNNNPNVAILGGGMSGIMCALALQEKGIRSTVFDTVSTPIMFYSGDDDFSTGNSNQFGTTK